MKRFFLCLCALTLIASVADAQPKASKDARKEAKEFERAGWIITPGKLPLERQFDRAYEMQYQTDDMGFPKFLMGEANTPGQTYDAAKFQALELAKLNLAGQLQTEVTALIDNSIANKQLSDEEAESITETVAASKNMIAQSIGRVIPVVECYRKEKKGVVVYVRIAYNMEMAKKAASAAMREELEKKSDKLHGQLDKILGFAE